VRTLDHMHICYLDQIHAKLTEMLVLRHTYRITIVLFVYVIHFFYSCIFDMHVSSLYRVVLV